MKKIINNYKKGFIQLPILIAIIAGVLVIGGGGYFGVNKYHNYKTEKANKEKMAQDLQQKALEAEKLNKEIQQQKDLEFAKLKQEIENLKTSQSKSAQQFTSSPQNTSISASELVPYLSGVVEIECGDVSGSGSLYTGGYVLTNFHVIEGQKNCVALKTEANSIGTVIYSIDTSSARSWNNSTDVAVVKLSYIKTTCYDGNRNIIACPTKDTPIENLNYKIFDLPSCEMQIPSGSPVAIVGYPAFSRTAFNSGGVTGTDKTRLVTTGIISGYETNNTGSPLWKVFPYPDYFISAKIDSGNSGGMAFSKDQNGLCVLGIPTWLTIGNYDTQGIVQNIHNVLYK